MTQKALFTPDQGTGASPASARVPLFSSVKELFDLIPGANYVTRDRNGVSFWRNKPNFSEQYGNDWYERSGGFRINIADPFPGIPHPSAIVSRESLQ